LKLKFQQVFRKTVADTRTIQLGRAVEQQQAAIKGRRQEQGSRNEAIQRHARELALPPETITRRTRETEEFLRMQVEARREHEREQPGSEKQS
jgi:hypothetical protein